MKTTEELKHVPFEMYARVLDRAAKAKAERDEVLEALESLVCVARVKMKDPPFALVKAQKLLADLEARAAVAPSPAGTEE